MSAYPLLSSWFSVVVFTLLLFFSGCGVTRVTTTQHTAVEQALLSESLAKASTSLNFSPVEDKTFFIKKINGVEGSLALSETEEEPVEGHSLNLPYAKSVVSEALLAGGARLAKDENTADLLIFVQIHTGSIDDSEVAFGIPSIPIPVPGVGSVETPALNLFEKHSQYGRSKVTVFAVETDTGSLAFSQTSDTKGNYYSRWGALFIIGWRTTDLEEPH